MPYIKPEMRAAILGGCCPMNAGVLNYMFTAMALVYIDRDESYQAYNDVIGALEAAKLELYRRRVAPYEDKKIEENGDVY